MTANEDDLDAIEAAIDTHLVASKIAPRLHALIAELRSSRASIGPDSREPKNVECLQCGHWMRHHAETGCQVVTGGIEWGSDYLCLCERKGAIGPDSERAELIIANALKPGAYPQDTPIAVAEVLRAAGLLRGWRR
jgi:hypothetical protein